MTYYEVLGANPMDQLDRIEDLFRQLAYNAEQSGDHSQVPLAVEAFKVLRDPAKRHQYDLHLSQQRHVAVRQQSQPVQQRQPQEGVQPPSAAQPQHQPTQSQQMPTQPQPAQHQPTQSPIVASPEQVQAAPVQDVSAVAPPTEQPAVSIPNVQAELAPAQAIESVPAPVQAPPAAAETESEDAPEFCPDTAQRRRREILAMFYKRRRDDAKNPGIAIGGIEQKVDYTYEVLEFHLWFMQQREWLLRLESGMFTITYLGVEEHEKNLIEGLIR